MKLAIFTSPICREFLICARCHDHKYAPVPQRDYYRLAAVFKGATDEHDWMKPVSRHLPHAIYSDEKARDLARYTVQHGINTLNRKWKTLKESTHQRYIEARL